MDAQDTATLDAGERVGEVNKTYATELENFPPLGQAAAEAAEYVAALQAKQQAQGKDTLGDTLAKDQARAEMATITETTSKRAVGYAMTQNDSKLKQQFTLTYTDINTGDETDDVNHVRDFVAALGLIPEKIRLPFRLPDTQLEKVLDAVKKFEKASLDQGRAKAGTRLATLSVPDLLTGLRIRLLTQQNLLGGVKDEQEEGLRWADFYAAFQEANKRRVVAPKRHPKPGTRVVRRFHFHRLDAETGPPLDVRPYAPNYSFTVENLSNNALVLWLAQADGVAVVWQVFPAGKTTVAQRPALGPDTATRLLARFEGSGGGDANIVVRRLVAEG